MKSALEQAEETLQNKLQQLDQDPEWNSDDEDQDEKAKEKKNRKQQKKVVQEIIKHDGNNKNIKDSTVIYIGHLPMHMQELELVAFLKQFGSVVNLRLSRSPKTGRPRGYAFCQFTSSDIANIVAETLSGYIVAGTKRLVCHVVPTCHRHLFDTKTNFIPTQKRTLPRRKSLAKLKLITTRLLQREGKKRKALAAKGIEYDFPGYTGASKPQDDNKNSKKSDNTNAPKDSKKQDKKKRKESIDSLQSAESQQKKKRKDSMESVENNLQKDSKKPDKKKRKESMDSVQSTNSQQQKKRKDSMASVESIESDTKKESKKRKESIDSVTKQAPMSEQKKKKPTKKDKKRRAST